MKRPRKDRKLPIVLNKDEVLKILSIQSNIKHKAILMLIYSAGLRVSEAVKLRVEDIDSKRGLVYIKVAKGRKDRYTILSNTTLEILRQYWKEYQPGNWLFEGVKHGRHISTRTIQAIFEQAKDKAGIKKDVSVHNLRHSFATHLLESGVDLRYIQELVGHKSSKTPIQSFFLTGQATEVYTHVSRKSLGLIKSPLDTLLREGGVIGDG